MVLIENIRKKEGLIILKKAVYNLIFGKSFYPNLEKINEFSPKEFIILGYKFVRHNNFKDNIDNLYYPKIVQEKAEIKSDKGFFEKIISNPDLAKEFLQKAQEDLDNFTFVKKEEKADLSKLVEVMGGEYSKKEIKENIGGHQLTYEVELPSEEKPAVISKDGTLLTDILLLLSIFTGARVIVEDNLNRYWQKVNLEMLECDYQKVIKNIENIISKFENEDFNFRLHGTNLFYYLELNSTQLLDLKFMILGTVLDSFTKTYVRDNEKSFEKAINPICKWDAVGNNKKSFANRLYFLLANLFLNNNGISGKNDYYLKTDKFVEIRNQIIHNNRLFPADELKSGYFTLANDLEKVDKFKRLFPFTKTPFKHEVFSFAVQDIYFLWKNIYTYSLLEILEIKDWYNKKQTKDVILEVLSK
ncbi:hypothetical protein MWH25_12045 [Natroniella acetigena]|uniref:hypothetical protein n=1 Tax=Natroniella acetigena TaxID=52004 RepID=UPI00200A5D38|nr:hypothetical protein [Natroniella acetigena]MCK8828459.1 hypothetical protein [Natroniella acetigena]